MKGHALLPVPGASILFALLATGALWWPLPALAQDAGRRVTIEGTRADNVYVAGGTVDVFGDLEKDLFATGGTVSVGQLVRGDVTVAGGAVHVGGVVGDDLRAAGGLVTVESQVGGDLVAMGGEIVVDRLARAAGRAWLCGGSVAVHGRVGGDLRVAAGKVIIGGEVGGNASLVARSIEVLPGARIVGNLTYASPGPARIDAGAQIGGRVTREAATWAENARRAGRVAFRLLKATAVLGLIVTGIVLLLVFPSFTRAASQLIGSTPGKSLGMGLLLLVVSPLVAAVLMLTILGIPLGLLTIALYLVALLVGFILGAIFLGDLIMRLARRGGLPPLRVRLLGFVLALVALAVVDLVPVLGGLVQLAILLLGLGALGLHLYQRYTRTSPAAP